MERKVSFGVDAFKVRSFSFSDNEETQNIRKDRINFNIGLKVNFVPEHNKFQVFLKIDALHGKQKPVSLGGIETETTFRLSGDLDTNEKGEVTLPDHLIISLISIAYSTTRGALMVKAQSTILADAPLPITDPTSMWNHFKENYQKDK